MELNFSQMKLSFSYSANCDYVNKIAQRITSVTTSGDNNAKAKRGSV
jgi:hypothetical protein